jgi:phage shock protein A
MAAPAFDPTYLEVKQKLLETKVNETEGTVGKLTKNVTTLDRKMEQNRKEIAVIKEKGEK